LGEKKCEKLEIDFQYPDRSIDGEYFRNHAATVPPKYLIRRLCEDKNPHPRPKDIIRADLTARNVVDSDFTYV